MNEPLTHAHFSPHTGKNFVFEGHSVTLRLTSVSLRPASAVPGSPRTPFTLIFTGPPADILPTGQYRSTAEDGSIFDLHIMPVHTSDRDRQDYQAAFN